MRAALIIVGLTCALATAAPADADVYTGMQDAQYLLCVAAGWGHASTAPVATISWGHVIADDITTYSRSPLAERDYIYSHTDIDSLVGANVMVNCATRVYLGFGPFGSDTVRGI